LQKSLPSCRRREVGTVAAHSDAANAMTVRHRKKLPHQVKPGAATGSCACGFEA